MTHLLLFPLLLLAAIEVSTEIRLSLFPRLPDSPLGARGESHNLGKRFHRITRAFLGKGYSEISMLQHEISGRRSFRKMTLSLPLDRTFSAIRSFCRFCKQLSESFPFLPGQQGSCSQLRKSQNTIYKTCETT